MIGVICDLFKTFYLLKNDVNVASKSNKQKNRAVSQRYGSADPDLDPYQNVTDPQHFITNCTSFTIWPRQV